MRLTPIVLVCALAGTSAARLDPSPIRAQIRAHMVAFRACYEKALVKNPKLEGRVTAAFTIGAKGTVIASKADGLPGVDECVAKEIWKLRFAPLPGSKGSVNVVYPFVFQPG